MFDLKPNSYSVIFLIRHRHSASFVATFAAGITNYFNSLMVHSFPELMAGIL